MCQAGVLNSIFPIINRPAYSLPLRCKAMNALGTLCAHTRVATWLVAHDSEEHSEFCKKSKADSHHYTDCPLRASFREVLLFFSSEESLFARSDGAFALQFLVKYASQEQVASILSAEAQLLRGLTSAIEKLDTAVVCFFFAFSDA